MKKILLQCCFLLAILQSNIAQVSLSADGPGNTYELINSKLAPGYDVVEAPDDSHTTFGRHIAEVFDNSLNKNVFEFYSHVSTDGDPSTGSADRQRVEIKTYASSPANLIGTNGETVTYKWLFKIPNGFKASSSFTHLHQIKPVNGDDADPIFTLTARKGTPNKLELIYVETSASASFKAAIIDLTLLEGQWVSVIENIVVGNPALGTSGKYAITLKRVSDGAVLLNYTNNNIATIRTDNSFIRPKWGIYRSLNTPADLRDEAVRFADFSIAEGTLAAQTYYWIGGANGSFTANANWNTQLDGLGTSRSATAIDDVLIFDGSNIGGTVLTTGTVTLTATSTSFGQIKLQNNANVVIQRPAGGGGTGTLTVNGDGTPDPDFVIGTGCNFTVNSPLTDGNIIINLLANVTGTVSGTFSMSNTGTHRITSQTTNGLAFLAGATFNSGGTPATAAYPFGSSTQSVQNGVIFQSGSNLVVTGNRSPMGGTSTFQACNMMPGSNTYFRSNASSATGSYANLKTYGNIFIENNATFTSDGPLYKVENITIDNGATFVTHSSGNTPILGNLTVNGTLSAPGGSTNIIVMGGSTPQTISGTGSINIPSFTVANYSDVSLLKQMFVSTTVNIVGKLSFSSGGQIAGTATFTARVAGAATSITGNTTEGSYLLTNIVGTLSGNAGLAIAGTGLDATTSVAGFSTANAVINLSKPATATATGVTYTFTSDSATLVSANPNGFDNATGAVVVSGTKTYQSGTNYIINAATTAPFGISATATTGIIVGNVLLNAPVTTNFNTRIRGTLTLGSGILTIRATDTVRVLTNNIIGGAPFSNSKYIACAAAGNSVGVLRFDDITTTTLFPIGTATKYLPVSLTPTSIMDFAASCFEGITTDGTPTGTAYSATQKADVVDAVWTINRITGSGDCAMQLSWPSVLEGSNFSAFPNNQVGINRYSGAIWEPAIGTGDNTSNTATATFTNFSPFSVGQAAGPLPVKLVNVYATKVDQKNNLHWVVSNEINVQQYIVETSMNGVDFKSIGAVNAQQISQYVFADATTYTATVYYRLKVVNVDGSFQYSNIVIVKNNKQLLTSVYPNPATQFIYVNGLSNNSAVKIVNTNGQVILTKSVKNITTLQIDVSTLPQGVYFVEAMVDQQVATSQFLKK
ncbi:beta strand repeat-containing protein [Ferruginibacter yonginensis]|uniref:Beta strand repeat-containing protein n=1 Tax=Ferruginibacter yonginensis TaxID=1310416 RepID=A0ABV8QSN2_9BACT